MSGVSTREQGRALEQEKRLREVEDKIRRIRNGRVTVDICHGVIKQVESTERERWEGGE